MGRPKAVKYANFYQYDKLHTKKSKMYSGVELTTLLPVKETEQFYQSIEVWSYCASNFKAKKPFTLSVNIPQTNNQRTIDFLKEHCWEDWVNKNKDSSEFIEAMQLLQKLFLNKKIVYFYELDSIISSYIYGDLISFDKSGNIEEPSEHNIENRKRLTHKYFPFYGIEKVESIKAAYTNYVNCDKSNQEERAKLFGLYSNLEKDYVYSNFNLDDVFIDVSINIVVYPVAFSKGTADWYYEKHKKQTGYAQAGEIYFIQTSDTVYFEIKRHY